MGKGSTGASTGTVDTSPAKRRKAARKRRREEAGWAARSGPVTIRQAAEKPGPTVSNS